MVDFGLEGLALGVFLVFVNLLIALFAFSFAWSRFKREEKENMLKETKALLNEDAREFTTNKFKTTFEVIRAHSIPSSHVIVFYYTSFKQAIQARKSGIPAHVRYKGIPLSLRDPTSALEADFRVFGKDDEGEYGGDENMEMNLKKKFPREEVLVLSLRKEFLNPLPGYEDDDALCMISVELLNAMRPTSFSAIIDNQPWLEDRVLLPPQCIVRSFWIMNIVSAKNRASSLQQTTTTTTASITSIDTLTTTNSFSLFTSRYSNNINNREIMVGDDNDDYDDKFQVKDIKLLRQNLLEPILISSIFDYVKSLTYIRQRAFKHNLVPLFHYTSLQFSSLISKSGLRMSSQGQGDGGVYFSTKGPASYGLGTPNYEENIIKDCFGIERLEEYLGKGRLDVVIVYGCEASILEQAPGGRENAKMISRSTFRDFSLEHKNGTYFLRQDRILGMFRVDPKVHISLNSKAFVSILSEKIKEKNVFNNIKNNGQKNKEINLSRINQIYDELWFKDDEDKALKQSQQTTLLSSNDDTNNDDDEVYDENHNYDYEDHDEEIGVSMEEVYQNGSGGGGTRTKKNHQHNGIRNNGKKEDEDMNGQPNDIGGIELTNENHDTKQNRSRMSNNPMLAMNHQNESDNTSTLI
eukprot:CAMPEP_0114339354 /NCGR_PEP_ID=MMETSP0101-20121206/7684_1 /TAXON_ID=38822 ORGANISM="Pteridomonas danica, Strain PT" /NCGR_SAMPLE_ID=MMETSP0101 /ASSEMBLY_ACC=CAM_ASM_000211 /LENGTH=636 /DNA_ID=CAMNT_0001472315 /DNA_START=238 /DNA_END=2148 /DNA_ORIENTATION=+